MTIDELEKINLEQQKQLDALTLENEQLKKDNAKAQEDYKKLQLYNNELFLQAQQKDNNTKGANNEIDDDDIVVESAEELEQLSIDAIREIMHKGE